MKQHEMIEWALKNGIYLESQEEKIAFRRKVNSTVCIEYWMVRYGYTEQEAIDKVSLKQKERCKNSKYYWIKHGFTEQEAIERANENNNYKQIQAQRNNPRCKNNQLGISDAEREKIAKETSARCIEYYLKKGFSKSESHKLLVQYQSKLGKKQKKGTMEYYKTRIWRPEYWIEKGYQELEAIDIIKKMNTRDVEYYVNKYGYEKGLLKYNKLNEKKKETWKNKTTDELVNHARKTAPKSYNESGQEMKVIQDFIKANNLHNYYSRYGSPKDQYWQYIPGIGYRRYDLAVFEKNDTKNPILIMEYHGFCHTRFEEYTDDRKNEQYVNFINKTIGDSVFNDRIKRKHIEETYPQCQYIVIWPDDYKNGKILIEDFND